MIEGDVGETRLRKLQDIAQQIDAFAHQWAQEVYLLQDASKQVPVPNGLPNDLSDSELAQIASMIYKGRRYRERHLSAEILGEPAWDILLDLFIAKLRRRDVRMTSAMQAGAVPATTGSRWVHVLERQGMVERFADGSDRRAVNVRLTEAGFAAMRACLAGMARAGIRP